MNTADGPDLRIRQTPQEVASECSDFILASLTEALKSQARAAIAISGGSSPRLLFSDMAKRQFDWSKVHSSGWTSVASLRMIMKAILNSPMTHCLALCRWPKRTFIGSWVSCRQRKAQADTWRRSETFLALTMASHRSLMSCTEGWVRTLTRLVSFPGLRW